MPMKTGQKAPKTVTIGLRNASYNLLRIRRMLTIPEVMETLCTGEERDAAGNIRTYFNYLVAAGVLKKRRVNDGKLTSNGTNRYEIIPEREIKPKAPVIWRDKGLVFDPNTQKTYPFSGNGANKSDRRRGEL